MCGSLNENESPACYWNILCFLLNYIADEQLCARSTKEELYVQRISPNKYAEILPLRASFHCLKTICFLGIKNEAVLPL